MSLRLTYPTLQTMTAPSHRDWRLAVMDGGFAFVGCLQGTPEKISINQSALEPGLEGHNCHFLNVEPSIEKLSGRYGLQDLVPI